MKDSKARFRSTVRRVRPNLESLEGRQLLAIVVTTTADKGAGSLRQAIIDANASTTPSTIEFNIGSGGPQSILPITPLPALSNAITIDGTSQPGYSGTPIIQLGGSQIKDPMTLSTGSNGLLIKSGNCTIRGLVINNFNGNGIEIEGGGKNLIAGDYIGTDISGQISFPNAGDGIFTINSRSNTIGGTTAADRNLISGNGGSGIDIISTTNNVVGSNIIQGNFIGTDATGLGGLGNTYDGITLNTTSNNTVGGISASAGNTIAYNGGSGVKVGDFYSYSGQQLFNAIVSNSITTNGNLGIDLQYGANNPVQSAVLSSAYPSASGNTIIEGSFNATPDTQYNLQFFSNFVSSFSGSGEGRTLIGEAVVTTDGQGRAAFTSTLPIHINPGNVLSATATSPGGSTSTFFHNTSVTSAASADLSIAQYPNLGQVTTGSPVTYTIVVSNNGPSRAQGVTVVDTLPANSHVGNVTTNQGTFTQANGAITFNIGTLDSNSSVNLTVPVTTNLLGKLTNTVVVQGTPTDPNSKNNTSVNTLNVVPSPYPPDVLQVQPVVGLTSIKSLIVNFNVPLDPAQATNAINYRVVSANRHGQFNRVVPLQAPVYNGSNLTVTLTPTYPFKLGTLYELQIDGQGAAGVTDVGGNLLTGNTSAGPLGPFFLQFYRGYVSPAVGGSSNSARSLGGSHRAVRAFSTHR